LAGGHAAQLVRAELATAAVLLTELTVARAVDEPAVVDVRHLGGAFLTHLALHGVRHELRLAQVSKDSKPSKKEKAPDRLTRGESGSS
jgi:hypothetical protein